MRLPMLAVATGAVVTIVAVAGCSDDSPPAAEADPDARLAAAADLLDQTEGVRFTLDGTNLPDSGTVVVSAEGSAAPPGEFDGEIRVVTRGIAAGIEVVSVDGQLWAKLPLTADFAEVDAETLGFADPGRLLDPGHGVSQLLRSATGLQTGDQVRVGAEVFDQITGTLPGELVGSILTIADPDTVVDATFAIDTDTGHLRQATLTGHFYPGADVQTYTVSLDDYDQPVDISAPTN